MEIWKDIPDYEGLYQASSFGRIRTCENKVTSNALHHKRVWKSRILRGRGDRPLTGSRVSLWKNGKQKDWLVARLVAMTFLGNPPHQYTVNHKDGNRLNNNIENLEWLSRADNIRHAFATGLMRQIQNEVTIKNDRSGEIFTFISYAECSRFLGRNHGYISGRLKRKQRMITASTGETFSVLPF